MKINYGVIKDSLDGILGRMESDEEELRAAEYKAHVALAKLAEIRRRVPASEVKRSVARSSIGTAVAENALRRIR